ncbi:hypothetical protein PG984_014786 [Apiospora sp. TS-2023a]
MSGQGGTPARPLSPWAKVLGGIPSSQLGPLNEFLGGGGVYGGHSAVDYNPDENRKRHRERLIDVNEDDWFDFFKKGRWWELDPKSLRRGPCIDNRQKSPIDRWNPQQKRIWEELRVILEFCNRALTKLLEERDPWLDALLFGDLVYSDLSSVPLKSSSSPPKRIRSGPSSTAVVLNCPLRRSTSLKPGTSFTASPNVLYSGFVGLSWGMSGAAAVLGTQPMIWRPMVWFNVIHLRVLVEREYTTPAQASIARFAQACTVLHELAHALYRVRSTEFNLSPGAEAYMGEEQIQELGMSFINHTFGGTMLGRTYPVTLPGQVQGLRVTLTDRILEGQELFNAYKRRPRDGWDVLRYGDAPTPLFFIPPDPDRRTNNTAECLWQVWQDPQDATAIVGKDLSRSWEQVPYDIGSALDGSNLRRLDHPVQYLQVYEREIKDKLSSLAQVHHSPWVSQCTVIYKELLFARRALGPKYRATDWAPFRYSIPAFRLDDKIADFPLPVWAPLSQGPVFQPTLAELFLLPTEIFERGLILIKTANPQGWSCYPIPKSIDAEAERPEGGESPCRFETVQTVRNPDSVAPVGRGEPSQLASDTLSIFTNMTITFCQVAEYNGALAMPDWRVLHTGVYDISRFLQSDKGQTEEATRAFQSPHQSQIDASSISRDLEASLRPYLCALIKPDNDTGATFTKDGSVVLTEKELANYCTPEMGESELYYQITLAPYLDHHPASHALLAKLGGRDITQAFNDAHNQPLTAIDMGDAKHTIKEVGRLVPTQTAIRDDQVVLDGFVFWLDDLDAGEATRQRWAGKEVTLADLENDSDDLSSFEELFTRCGDRAVAKYEDVAGGP